MISRIFWNFIDFGFKKMMKKYRLTSEGNGRIHAQNDKTIINTIYMKPDFPIIKKLSKNYHVNVPHCTLNM